MNRFFLYNFTLFLSFTIRKFQKLQKHDTPTFLTKKTRTNTSNPITLPSIPPSIYKTIPKRFHAPTSYPPPNHIYWSVYSRKTSTLWNLSSRGWKRVTCVDSAHMGRNGRPAGMRAQRRKRRRPRPSSGRRLCRRSPRPVGLAEGWSERRRRRRPGRSGSVTRTVADPSVDYSGDLTWTWKQVLGIRFSILHTTLINAARLLHRIGGLLYLYTPRCVRYSLRYSEDRPFLPFATNLLHGSTVLEKDEEIRFWIREDTISRICVERDLDKLGKVNDNNQQSSNLTH